MEKRRARRGCLGSRARARLVNSRVVERLIKKLIETGGWRDASRLVNEEDEAIAWVTSREN